MICWQWGTNRTVNYTSAKYFKVRLQNYNYVAWVHSSQVYYQSTVPRC